jgi:hypothetical protein
MPATDLKLMVSLPTTWGGGATWCHALTIPTEVLPTYCHYPLKWVRYLGYTIVGVKGRLSRKKKGGPTADYTLAACDEELGGVYFYIAKGGMHIQRTPNM